jgi:hypothetical protein
MHYMHACGLCVPADVPPITFVLADAVGVGFILKIKLNVKVPAVGSIPGGDLLGDAVGDAVSRETCSEHALT